MPSSVKSQDLILPSNPGESHGRLACYASQGNGCSMGCALSTAARFEYAGSGFIPTSGRTTRQERSLLLIPEGFVYIWALTRVSGVSEFTAVKLNKIHVCRLACQTNVELSWFHWISESMVFL